MRALSSFTKTSQTQSLAVSAELFQISPEHLLLEFHFSGDLQKVVWPQDEGSFQRRDGLWQHTCLEAFFSFGATEQAPYVEINCSPNGNWNAYSFSSYRQGMAPCQNITVRLKHRESEAQDARFQIEISSTEPLQIAQLGLTAVVEFQSGEKSYWALSHPGPQADFHNKAGWMTLATQ